MAPAHTAPRQQTPHGPLARTPQPQEFTALRPWGGPRAESVKGSLRGLRPLRRFPLLGTGLRGVTRKLQPVLLCPGQGIHALLPGCHLWVLWLFFVEKGNERETLSMEGHTEGTATRRTWRGRTPCGHQRAARAQHSRNRVRPREPHLALRRCPPHCPRPGPRLPPPHP